MSLWPWIVPPIARSCMTASSAVEIILPVRRANNRLRSAIPPDLPSGFPPKLLPFQRRYFGSPSETARGPRAHPLLPPERSLRRLLQLRPLPLLVERPHLADVGALLPGPEVRGASGRGGDPERRQPHDRRAHGPLPAAPAPLGLGAGEGRRHARRAPGEVRPARRPPEAAARHRRARARRAHLKGPLL